VVRLNVTQDGYDATDHADWLVRTVVETDADATANRCETADKVRVGPIGCVAVNVAVAPPAASTTVPLRAAVPELAEAVTVRTAPLAPLETFGDSQDGCDATDHEAWVVVTVMLALPPCPSSVAEVGEADTVGTGGGIVAVTV
jgi:hypothetical protein